MKFNKFTSLEKIFCAFPTFKASASLGLCQIHRVREHSPLALAVMRSNGFRIALTAIISWQRVESLGVLTEDLTLGWLG